MTMSSRECHRVHAAARPLAIVLASLCTCHRPLTRMLSAAQRRRRKRRPPAKPAAPRRRRRRPASAKPSTRRSPATSKRSDREFGLVKRVVKLVTPAVVHIESKPLPQVPRACFTSKKPAPASSSSSAPSTTCSPIATSSVIRRRSRSKSIWPMAACSIRRRSGATAKPTSPRWRSTPAAWPPRELGDSDALEIGDFVLAVGSPFGLSQSVTRGIVSAKGRHNLDLGDDDLKWQNFIQTDAAINPGNSGGPLVNLRGEVVGLNTAIASASGGNEGIGFSIPINIVARIAQALVDNHQVPRGFLGVKLDINFNQQRAESLGLGRLVGTRITGVEPQVAGRAGQAAGQRRDPRIQRRPRSSRTCISSAS